MPGSLSAAEVDDRESQRRIRRPGAPCFKLTGVTAMAALSLTVALSSARSKPVRAENALQAGPNVQAATPGGLSGFAAEIQRTLKEQHDRMIDLAKQLIGRDDELGHLWNQKINQDITAESAKANFSNAVLAREVSEIAVLEYEQGIFIQDRATAQGEIVLANSDLKRAPQAVELWKGRLADINKASKGSAADLATEFAFADRVVIAERQVGKRELANQQAESKLKILLEYTRSRRVKELQSELEKARSAELENRATWKLANSKAKRLEEAIKMHERSARERRAQDLLDRQALAALDSAIPIEAQLRTKLEQLKKNEKRDDSLEKEAKDLANQLEALVDRSEAKRAAARFDALKTTIHSAASRFPGSARSRAVRVEGVFEAGPNAQAPNQGNQSGFAAEIQRILTKHHDHMIKLATQLVETDEAPEKLDDQLSIQQIMIESAKAKLDQAVLNREVAEIALGEFEKGTFLLDKATAEAELKMARAELERARQNIEPAKDRFARIQKASKGSTSDIANEITYGDGVFIAQARAEQSAICGPGGRVETQGASRIHQTPSHEGAPIRGREGPIG